LWLLAVVEVGVVGKEVVEVLVDLEQGLLYQ
jgi:hypothetical protein